MQPFSPAARIAARAIAAVVFAAALVSLAGCSGSNTTNTTNPNIRVVDAIPNGGSATPNIAGTSVSALSFFKATDYAQYTVSTTMPPAFSFTLTSPATTFGPFTQAVNGAQFYTAVMLGRADITNTLDIRYPRMNIIPDDRTTPAGGDARVRVIHAAPDAGNVDVVMTGTGITTLNLVTNASYTSAAGFQEAKAQVVQFTVNQTGTATAVVPSTTFTLLNGHLYTIFILEQPNVATPTYTIQLTDETS